MSCPYSDEQLEFWDSVTNAMGNECYSCIDFDCEHNNNEDDPERCGIQDDDGVP